MALPLLVVLMAPAVLGCSNFAMENSYGLSVRTEDINPGPFFALITQPATSTTLGFVAFAAMKHGPDTAPLNASQGIKAGINTAGLSCDKQSLSETVFPSPKGNDDIDGALLCRWALESFPDISSLKAGIDKVNFIAPAHDVDFANGHWALRDALGLGVVIEFVAGMMHVYDDNNDGGKTGYGVMTNSPTFPWQLENVRFHKWKEGKFGAAVAIDGSWYPDARFQRLVLVKSTMPEPTSIQEAISQAVHCLNTVTVPMGSQPGKDMKSAEGHRTEFAVVWDHKNAILYWRAVQNQNLARLRLEDAGLKVGGQQRILSVQSPKLPWFNDAASALMGGIASPLMV